MHTPGRFTALVVILLLGMSACSVSTGSGQVRSESRQVSGFTAVDLSGSGAVTIEQTGRESLTVEAEESLLPLLTSDVSGGTLHLGEKPNTVVINRQPIRYRVTVKDLTGLSISGSGSVTVAQLTTPRLDTDISGSGDVTVAGEAEDEHLDISGSGRYQARDLRCSTADLSVSGSGRAEVSVSDSLHVDISGSGSVRYHGQPTVDQHISGSGHLTKG